MAVFDTTLLDQSEVKRRCKKCGDEKQLDAFPKSPTCSLGRRFKCKACVQAGLTPEQRECVRLRGNAWAADHRDVALQRALQWQRDNPERTQANRIRWVENHPEYVRDPAVKSASDKRWYEANKDHVLARQRAYLIAHPEVRRTCVRNRRARRAALPGKHTRADIAALFVVQKGRCAICKKKLTKGRDGQHVDHIMPCKLKGSNDRRNLQLLCGPCNRDKGSKHPIDFMQSRGFLL